MYLLVVVKWWLVYWTQSSTKTIKDGLGDIYEFNLNPTDLFMIGIRLDMGLDYLDVLYIQEYLVWIRVWC